jgi:HEAT repeats
VKDEDLYLPKSEFLIMVCNEEIPFDDSDFGRANLQRLIALTTDKYTSNRDWAALLLGQFGPNTDEVRAALVRAAEDEDQFVRGEAIEHLVERDRAKALALVKRELAGGFATVPVLYAATKLANPSLFELLEHFAEPSGDSFLDGLWEDAMKACEPGAKRGPATRSA